MFLGELSHLYEFMMTMQMMRLFEKGEYMVISVDWEIFSPERANDYLWSERQFQQQLPHLPPLVWR